MSDDLVPLKYFCIVSDVKMQKGNWYGKLRKVGPEAFKDRRRFNKPIKKGSTVYFDLRFASFYMKDFKTAIISDDLLVEENKSWWKKIIDWIWED